MNNPFKIYGDNRHEFAQFQIKTDAINFIIEMAARGDWRGFKNISVFYAGSAVHTVTKGVTH